MLLFNVNYTIAIVFLCIEYIVLKFNKRLEDMEYKTVFVATKIKYICHKILDKKLQEHYQKNNEQL